MCFDVNLLSMLTINIYRCILLWEVRQMNDEYISFTEAQKFLHVSQTKLTRLVRDMGWTIHTDPLDKRVRLLKRADIERDTRPRMVSDVVSEALAKREATE
jgi:hypothetical protein